MDLSELRCARNLLCAIAEFNRLAQGTLILRVIQPAQLGKIFFGPEELLDCFQLIYLAVVYYVLEQVFQVGVHPQLA